MLLNVLTRYHYSPPEWMVCGFSIAIQVLCECALLGQVRTMHPWLKLNKIFVLKSKQKIFFVYKMLAHSTLTIFNNTVLPKVYYTVNNMALPRLIENNQRLIIANRRWAKCTITHGLKPYPLKIHNESWRFACIKVMHSTWQH